MEEINNILLPRMNNGAHIAFIRDVIMIAEKDEEIKNKVGGLIKTLKEKCEEERIAMSLSKKSLLTDEIRAADEMRDRLYSSYKQMVNSYLNFPNEEHAAAAGRLWQRIKDYRINPRRQKDEETGLMSKFVRELKGDLADDVNLLGLMPYAEKMGESNSAVERLDRERTLERMNRKKGALAAARVATDEAYHALVKMVNALALVEGEEKYLSFILHINAEVKHFKREVIIGRKKRQQKTADLL